MSAYELTDRLPRVSTTSTEVRTSIRLAAVLLAGLVVFTPLFAIVLGQFGVPRLPALLLGVGMAGLAYGAAALVTRRLLLGMYVAAVVLSTFAANVPLAPDSYLRLLPGSIGPQLWLVEFPLVILLIHHLRQGRFSLTNVPRVEYALGGFVLWTVVSALFSVALRPDVGLYYSLLMLHIPIAFAVIHRGVATDEVSFRTVLAVFILSIVGHLPVAVAQLINQQPLNLSPLGESVIWANVSYPPLGYVNNVIVSGLTGHGYVLAALLIIAIPVVLMYLVWVSGRLRALVASLVVAMAALLRLSTSDAARGAILLTIVVTGLTYVLVLRFAAREDTESGFDISSDGILGRWRTHLPYGATALAVTLLALYPSSKAGTSIQRNNPSEGNSGGGESSTTVSESSPGGDVATREVPNIGEATGISDLSVPLFNLGNLGSRLQQYVVGLDLFFEHPILGIGGGNYPFFARQYGLANKANIPIPQPLHNVYLGLLVETGLPGFLLYTAALILVLRAGFRLFRENSGLDSLLAAGVTTGFIGILGLSFWTHSIDKITILVPFWMLAGALVAAAGRSVGRARTG